jgi:hypothetical protein
MAKAVTPGTITIPNVGNFIANAVPDPFDERDLVYRPRLQPLPAKLDCRKDRAVLEQEGQSCVGHAMAAMINTVLAHTSNGRRKSPQVSPYMLYWLARRYDEFEGEEDVGSSLRGGLKGWFNHGCALLSKWPKLDSLRDLDDPEMQAHCAERPLGAFYRINAFRLDDMQSALNELHVIVASAAIHDGWEEPRQLRKGGATNHAILRPVNPKALGGHAFALVGYDEIGFLVQNSWGTGWGKGGFATLPYEDWLDSAYDAWVARPGVPRTPFAAGRNRAALVTRGGIATGPGPDLRRLTAHVVNLGNDGRLSNRGKFASSPAQIETIFHHMDEAHRDWTKENPGLKRHVVLYAHGGLVSEAGGLETAEKHLNWWMNNRVYPVYFAWQSGAGETLLNQLVDLVRTKLPFGGIGFDIAEQFDRLVEKTARVSIRQIWDEMKENARKASDPIKGAGVKWPPNGATDAMAKLPGASLTVSRLANYVNKDHPGTLVHLVGHSAGSIFHAALLQRLVQENIPVATLNLLAPAIRVDEFRRDMLPHLGAGKKVARTGVFALSDRRELDDVCGAGGVNVYQKSLLYLVSRALERLPGKDQFEVDLLGMERFFDAKLRNELTGAGGDLVVAPSEIPAASRSDSLTHGGFDDDSPTMTSVVLRILGKTKVDPVNVYRAHTALADTKAAAAPAPEGIAAAAPRGRARKATPLPRAVATAAPGETPVVQTAAAPEGRPKPPEQKYEVVLEVASAPRTGSPIFDMLQATGWTPTSGGDRVGNGSPEKRRKPDRSAGGSKRPRPA